MGVIKQNNDWITKDKKAKQKPMDTYKFFFYIDIWYIKMLKSTA